MTIIKEVLAYLQVIIIAVVLGSLPYIKNELKKLVPVAIEFMVAKIGEINSNRIRVFALQVFYKLNEDTRTGDFLDDKLTEFDTILTKKYPKLTATQIDLLNKSIAGKFNKDKEVVEKVLETPIETIAATKKYYDENGNELVAKVADKPELVPADSTVDQKTVINQASQASPTESTILAG